MNYAIYINSGKINKGYLFNTIVGLILLKIISRWFFEILNIMFENADENKKFKTIFDNQDESIIIINTQ